MSFIRHLLLAFLVSASHTVMSQQEPSVSNDASVISENSVDENAQEVVDSLAEINQLLEDISLLDNKMTALDGDELKAAIIKRRDKASDLVKALKRFGKVAVDYAGGTDKLKQLLQSDWNNLLKTGVVLRNGISHSYQQLEKNSKGRDTLTAEGLKTYLDDNKLVDISFSLLSQFVKIVLGVEQQPKLSLDFLNKMLPARAEFLSDQISLSNERIDDLGRELSRNKEDTDLQTKLALSQEKLAAEIQSLKSVIELSIPLSIDMQTYQTLLVKMTGEISTETLSADVLTELLNDWWLASKYAIQENTISFLIKALVFVFIIVVFRYLAKLIGRILERSLNSNKVKASELLKKMLVTITGNLIMLLGILVALAQLGISLAPILAGLGVVGFIVGFALQDTLGNFAAGVMILFYRPYDVGDAVEVGGVAGKVKHMSIVNTTILTFDNQTLILPNSKIWGDVIKNITAQETRRIDMVFGIGYNDDIEKAEKVLHDIVYSHELTLSSPEPVIRLHTLAESSVDFIVRPWVKREDYWKLYWDITREVKLRFDQEGITIPYPQRDLHHYQEK